MKWYCECGQKISGEESYCPNCSAKMEYRCKKCGKEMTDGKHYICPSCNTLKVERRDKALKICAKAVGVAGGAAVFVVKKVIDRKV